MIEDFLDEENEANGEFQNAQWTDGMCPNLQVVRLKGVLCSSNEMCFIQLLLSKATVLRTLSINLGYGSLKSREDALCELITYRRGSPYAQSSSMANMDAFFYAFLDMCSRLHSCCHFHLNGHFDKTEISGHVQLPAFRIRGGGVGS